MKFLFASDSFKGTLTSDQTIELLTKAAEEVFGSCETSGVPVADGGEGTTDAVVKARSGEIITVPVHGPLMEMEQGFYGRLSDTEAILEMAAASGLPMVPEEKRNPLNTTTYGTGELLKAALEERLDGRSFVRVSNSEIVNLKRVTALDLRLTGTIRMTLTGGVTVYVSRRYVKKIKEVLGL